MSFTSSASFPSFPPLFWPNTPAAGASPLMKNSSKAAPMVSPSAAMAASSSLPNSPSSPTLTLPISGPFVSIPKAHSTPRAALLRKSFASIRTANPRPSSIPQTSRRKPSPSIRKARSMSALLPTARSIAFLLPERSPSFRSQNEIHLGSRLRPGRHPLRRHRG